MFGVFRELRMNLKRIYLPKKAKANSERIILAANGRVNRFLPFIDCSHMRTKDEIIGRALVLNALVNIHFGAPTEIARSWLERNDLSNHLSTVERELLSRSNEELNPQELIDLYWNIECLWALLWVRSLVDHLDFNYPIQDYMASLCPSLQEDENTEKFTRSMQIRPFDSCFQMLDLHYRLHWWMRQDDLDGQEENDTYGRVWERRKALEWVMDGSTDWDNINLST